MYVYNVYTFNNNRIGRLLVVFTEFHLPHSEKNPITLLSKMFKPSLIHIMIVLSKRKKNFQKILSSLNFQSIFFLILHRNIFTNKERTCYVVKKTGFFFSLRKKRKKRTKKLIIKCKKNKNHFRSSI